MQVHKLTLSNFEQTWIASSVQNAHDWIWLGKSTLDPASTSGDCESASATSRSQKHLPHRFSSSEVNVISNPLRIAPDDLHLAERIPLKQLHTTSRSTASAAYSCATSQPPTSQLQQTSSHHQPHFYPQRHFASEQHLPASHGKPSYCFWCKKIPQLFTDIGQQYGW